MMKIKKTVSPYLLLLLGGVLFASDAFGFEVKVSSTSAVGRSISLPTGSFLYENQTVRVEVQVSEPGVIDVHYFENGNPVANFSRTANQTDSSYIFPNQKEDWKLTGGSGPREFEIEFTPEGGSSKKQIWHGEFVAKNKRVNRKTTDTAVSEDSLQISRSLLSQISKHENAPIEKAKKMAALKQRIKMIENERRSLLDTQTSLEAQRKTEKSKPKNGRANSEGKIIGPDVLSDVKKQIAEITEKMNELRLKIAKGSPEQTISTRGGSAGSSVYKRSAYSVVKVMMETGSGAGVIVSDQGVIVTNYHVIGEKSIGAVALKAEGRVLQPSFLFKVLRRFPLKDLAFIKVNFDEHLKILPIKIAEVSDVDEGDKVFAIGHPLGNNWSITEGIISAKRNSFFFGQHKGLDKRADVFQMQAPISPGNSGGALLNSNGELIGVNTFSRKGGQNLNFAIAANEVKTSLASLRQIKAKTTQKKPSLVPPNGKLVSKTDANKNGSYEVITYKVFGSTDGDWLLIDVDDDGITDRVDIDRNGDGFFEENLRIQRRGSSWEKVGMIDEDSDGQPDFLVVDKDLDGTWDSFRSLN
jgi:S1-C subfamily serine protease